MAGRFNANSIEQVRSANDIVEVIGAHLPLKRAGGNWVALCPFHREKSPSFNVNPQKQIFHCFGCHKGGDVFTFVQEYESVEFAEAVRRLADRAGITLEFDSEGGAGANRSLKETLWQIHELTTQRWQAALANDAAGEPARAYLARRQVSAEAIKLFRLGFAPEAWDDTVNWARSKGFDLAVVEQAGLILRKEGESKYYDRFRGRLMFPINDELGRVIGFSGRILQADVKAAKYVNSPETPIFQKRKVFFGLDKSKRAILEARFAVICEGQLDLIACFMVGVQNVVAPQGTALTADHARLLKRYADEAVLCFDADPAGQAAAVRVLDDLLDSGLAIRVATVPAPHDPDSFIKEFGGPAFQQRIAQAQGFFDFYLDLLRTQHDAGTDKGRLAILTAMGTAVRKTGNAVLTDTYAQKTALRLGVSPVAVRAEFAKVADPRVRKAADTPPETAPAATLARPSIPELWLLKLLFHDDIDRDWLSATLNLDWIQHPVVREVYDRVVAAHREGRRVGVTDVLAALPDPPAKSLLTEAVSESRALPEPQRQVREILTRLRNQAIDRQLERLVQQTAQPELSDEARRQLLQRQQDLRSQKKSTL